MSLFCYSLFLFACCLLLSKIIFSFFNTNPPKKRTNHRHYAILIPARDESKVIEELLVSIENQTKKIDSGNVYVIVEDKSDPTVEIVKKHHMRIVYRKNLSLHRKGYALNDALELILKEKKHYDAYFIFDADNVLDAHFIEKMEQSIDEGYDIGIGYRNCKNGNDSIFAASSALTFSMINSLGNGYNAKWQKNLTISGTGFYIRGDLIEQWGGYPFHTLTEDYELTLYSILQDYTSTYNKKAIFYDEQPVTYRETIIQRTRWVRGYFDSRKKYRQSFRKKLRHYHSNYASTYTTWLGVYPYILMLVSIILLLGYNMWLIFPTLLSGKNWIEFGLKILILLLFVYFILLITTLLILIKEEHQFNLTLKMKIKVLFFNPIFLLTYIICLFRSFSKKGTSWEKMEHNKKMFAKR